MEHIHNHSHSNNHNSCAICNLNAKSARWVEAKAGAEVKAVPYAAGVEVKPRAFLVKTGTEADVFFMFFNI